MAGSPGVLKLLLLAVILLHLPDGVQEEQDQDGHLEGDTEDAEDGGIGDKKPKGSPSRGMEHKWIMMKLIKRKLRG